MIRPFALCLALIAPAAQACAVAEGCPMGEAPSGCATVRVEAGRRCVDDPSAPGGFRIEAALPCEAGASCILPLAPGPEARMGYLRALALALGLGG